MTALKLRPPYAGVTMHSAPALRNRPALAAEIAVAIGVWAEIEHMLGLILADMLGSNAELALSIFFALRTEGPQQAVITATARHKLTIVLVAELKMIIKKIGNNATERNALSHGIWGYVDKRPDNLLWMDWAATMQTFSSTSPSALDSDQLPIDIYTLKDLKRIAEKHIGILDEITRLHREVRDHVERNPPEPPAR